MPTIEIMSPMSDTGCGATFIVAGEHDLATVVKDAFTIRCEYRETGTSGAWLGGVPCTVLMGGGWNCTLTVPSGHNYDVRATLYDGDTPQKDVTDTVQNIMVSTTPPLGILMPGMPLRAALAAKLLTGTSDPNITGTITCTIFRVSHKRRRVRPIAFYTECGRMANGDWFVNPAPAVLHRPGAGDGKTFLIIVCIVGANGRVKAFTSAALYSE